MQIKLTTTTSRNANSASAVSVSLNAVLIERIRAHAAKTDATFSAATRDLVSSGLAARCVPRGQPSGDLLSDLLDRLSETGAVTHAAPSLWSASCPVNLSTPHRLFLFAEVSADDSPDFATCDLFCSEFHCAEEILSALRLNPHQLVRSDAREIPTWP
jgi:hypothetical protein